MRERPEKGGRERERKQLPFVIAQGLQGQEVGEEISAKHAQVVLELKQSKLFRWCLAWRELCCGHSEGLLGVPKPTPGKVCPHEYPGRTFIVQTLRGSASYCDCSDGWLFGCFVFSRAALYCL